MISKLHYITNGNTAEEILAEVNNVVDAGIDWVQLRIKNKDLDFLFLAKEVQEICKGKSTFIINDNVTIAKTINADGIHLGLSDMPIKEARAILGKNKIIGGTANTLQDCINRIEDGADYIGLGPYRATKTKKKLSPIIGFKEISPLINGKITIPILAIGGIRLEDIEALIKESNIHGIAVSSLIANEKNKKDLILNLNNKIQKFKNSKIQKFKNQITNFKTSNNKFQKKK